jgi:sirohydrochlorin cobaltochelatase
LVKLAQDRGKEIAMTDTKDKAAPMASAPMQYRDNGEVAWGEMWENFCALALEGGPPHRGDLLKAQLVPDTHSPTYQQAVQEIVRGIREVSGLPAAEARPGWIGITCPSPAMAGWLAEAIVAEQVEAKAEAHLLLVPVGDYYTVKGEIKNVITAVAKTTHYWGEHLPPEVKQTLAIQAKLAGIGRWLRRLGRTVP